MLEEESNERTYKTIEYARNECKSMADQIAILRKSQEGDL